MSRKKVCGPNRSCEYPRTYKRFELVRLAKKRPAFSSKAIEKAGKEELCSRLGLAMPEVTDNYRFIRGKLCGPNKSSYSKKVWSKRELGELAHSRGYSRRRIKKATKLRLCVDLAEEERKERLAKPKKLRPVAVTRSLMTEKQLDYEGEDEYLLPILYSLVHKHKNLKLFIDKRKEDEPYIGVIWDCAQDLGISEELIPQMKACNQPFFFCLVLLADSSWGTDQHVNFLVWNVKKNRINLYEPWGSKHVSCNKAWLEEKLAAFFKEKIGASFEGEAASCPRKGLQTIEGKQRKTIADSAAGYCAMWNIWTIDMKLTYPKMSLKKIVARGVKLLQEDEYGINNYIVNYTNDMLKTKAILEDEAEKSDYQYSEDYIRDLIAAEMDGR
jgi:hypothetical protein